MGSLTPLCPLLPLPSTFNCMLIKFSPACAKSPMSADRDQLFRTLLAVRRFGHVENRYPAQDIFNAVADLAQRLAHRAPVRLIAGPADGHARGHKKWTVDRLNHV